MAPNERTSFHSIIGLLRCRNFSILIIFHIDIQNNNFPGVDSLTKKNNTITDNSNFHDCNRIYDARLQQANLAMCEIILFFSIA